MFQPKHLYSMTHLLKIRQANSYEQSTFLVSLLLGLGFNAYVVHGYASRETCLCDRRMQSCPYLPEEKNSEKSVRIIDKTKYRPKSPPDFTSKFLEELKTQEYEKIKADLEKQEDRCKQMIIVS